MLAPWYGMRFYYYAFLNLHDTITHLLMNWKSVTLVILVQIEAILWRHLLFVVVRALCGAQRAKRGKKGDFDYLSTT
jgi:hypothetical protein